MTHATNVDLSGKHALVTGGGSGIGQAAAERLAAAGAHVTVLDLDADRAADVAERIEGTALAMDLTDLDQIAQRLDPRIDILVNNAGIQVVSPLQDFPVEKFHLILTLMLEAPFRLIRHALPNMYAQGWGRIINISSIHGLRASPFKSAYISAKHGLEGLSKTAALEGAPHGVTSNCINPAYVRTPLVEGQLADQAQTHGISEAEVVENIMLQRAAIKRLIEPSEVGEFVAFLCSPPASFITGASLPIDGGWTAH